MISFIFFSVLRYLLVDYYLDFGLHKLHINMKHKKNKNDYFNEEYVVKLNYKKKNGYWVYGHEELVLVSVKNGVNEKNNHERAESIAKKKFPGCNIVNVSYV